MSIYLSFGCFQRPLMSGTDVKWRWVAFQIGKTISLLFFTLQVLSIYAGHDEINLHHVREFDFFPLQKFNGTGYSCSFRKEEFSFSFFLMRIWVLCKLCHNEISCTFHHVALCWRMKQMVNWYSGNCSKIKKTGNHCFSVTLLDKITQTKHYLKCYFKSAVYYFISISF